MYKYLIKAGFKTPSHIETARRKVSYSGVSPDDIDYISQPLKTGKGLKFKRRTEGPYMASKLLVVGVVFGFLVYGFNLFSHQEATLIDTLLQIKFFNLFTVMSICGLAFMGFGFLIGRKSPIHVVKYSDTSENTENLLLAVNVSEKNKDSVYKALKQMNPINIDVLNLHQEVEIGART